MLYIVGSTDMIHRPFAERADPEFYLFLPLWQREHWGRVQKGQCDCIKATVQSNLLATIIIHIHIHFLWIAGSCL